MQVNRPKVTVECAGVQIASEPIKNMNQNSNFSNPVQFVDLVCILEKIAQFWHNQVAVVGAIAVLTLIVFAYTVYAREPAVLAAADNSLCRVSLIRASAARRRRYVRPSGGL